MIKSPQCWLTFLLLAGLLPTGPLAMAADDDAWTLQARRRVETAKDGGRWEVRENSVRLEPGKTALIICDMWDKHWCQGATRRVAAMAPRMNQTIHAARKRGVLIIHAPSDCMAFYQDTPQRKRAQQAPADRQAPPNIDQGCRRLPREPALPIDDSDGGCDCQPQCKVSHPWRREIAALDVADQDAISDSGREIWNLLAQRGIDNVLILGVHTNMCVLGRPFGLRQMVRAGKKVYLVRDLTDAMYNPRRAPRVSHERGTELVIQHIEKYVCPSIGSQDILGDKP